MSDGCERIAHYFDDNELIINLKKGKTESMIFGTAKRLKKVNADTEVSYRCQNIGNVEEYKYLGNICKNLNFNKSFDSVYKRALTSYEKQWILSGTTKCEIGAWKTIFQVQ